MQCHCSVLHNSVVTSTSSRIRLRFVVEGMRPDQVTNVIIAWLWQNHHIMSNHYHYVAESMRPDQVTCHNCATMTKSSCHLKSQSSCSWGHKTSDQVTVITLSCCVFSQSHWGRTSDPVSHYHLMPCYNLFRADSFKRMPLLSNLFFIWCIVS